MKFKLYTLILGLFFLGACMSGKDIEVEGTIKYIGATPHHYLALEDNKHHIFKISNPDDFNLQSLQNQQVKAKLKLIKEPIGAGFPAVVKIVNIDTK